MLLYYYIIREFFLPLLIAKLQEEYKDMDDVGTLRNCGHDYHVNCIRKWLSMKNICPICKSSAVPDNMKDK